MIPDWDGLGRRLVHPAWFLTHVAPVLCVSIVFFLASVKFGYGVCEVWVWPGTLCPAGDVSPAPVCS